MHQRNARFGLWSVRGLPARSTAASCCSRRFRPRRWNALPLAGVNLAIWYGFGLIVAALVLALIYGWLCRHEVCGIDARRDAEGEPVIHDASPLAIAVFAAFVARHARPELLPRPQAKSSAGYFAAHGQIPWFVNGVAFAGDYLSAASFLGICGMIAFYGYDGFLYSIGYLAGWIVALFVIAEPMKRLGKFTFADALDSAVQLAAASSWPPAISTLAVSVFYLIPQMVGAGVLVQPLLGLAALGGRGDRRRGGDPDRGHGGHGLDDVGAVHQGLAAGLVQRGADGDDPRTAASTATTPRRSREPRKRS